MRLYNILYICKTALPAIDRIKIVEVRGNEVYYSIKNWRDCKKSLDALHGIECFREGISRLYGMLWRAQVNPDEIRLQLGEMGDFRKYMDQICSSVEAIVKLCDMMEMGQAESGIDIKIPKCDSLKEYMGYLKEIDFLFTQCPYLTSDKEEVKFNTVDVGSQWLSLVVLGSAGAFYILTNLAKLIQKAVEVKSNIIVYRQQEEELKGMCQKNEVGEEVVEAFKKLRQITMDKCVADLEGEMGELKDNEERDKVKRSVESLAFLMEKGVEIYSSIETPKEIKVLFPFQKDTAILTDDILKFIEDKKVSTDGES